MEKTKLKGDKMNIDIDKDGQELVSKTEMMIQDLGKINIATADDCVNGAEILKTIKAKKKEIEDKRISITAPMDKAKKLVMDFFRKPIELLDNAEREIKNKILKYQIEQKRIADEKQAELQAIADKQAKKLRKQAELAGMKGNFIKSDTLKRQAENISIVPSVTANIPQVSGVSSRKIWKFEIVDINLIPRVYMIPDEVKIGRMVRSTEGSVPMPGIRIYSEDTISVTAGKKEIQ
jgi:hypothetical protein